MVIIGYKFVELWLGVLTVVVRHIQVIAGVVIEYLVRDFSVLHSSFHFGWYSLSPMDLKALAQSVNSFFWLVAWNSTIRMKIYALNLD